jgi:large subunit ribosomal protein L5
MKMEISSLFQKIWRGDQVMAYVPTLKKKYQEEIIPALMKEFDYKTVMQVPKLEKIILNQGVGSAIADKKIIEVATER